MDEPLILSIRIILLTSALMLEIVYGIRSLMFMKKTGIYITIHCFVSYSDVIQDKGSAEKRSLINTFTVD